MIIYLEPFDLSNAARSVFDEYVFKKVLDVFRKSNKIHKETKNINDFSILKLIFYEQPMSIKSFEFSSHSK